jgi:hypothetical protein
VDRFIPRASPQIQSKIKAFIIATLSASRKIVSFTNDADQASRDPRVRLFRREFPPSLTHILFGRHITDVTKLRLRSTRMVRVGQTIQKGQSEPILNHSPDGDVS